MSQELYIAEITMFKQLTERRQEIRRIEEQRLARQRQGWLAKQGCRFLCYLGNLLVVWGQRLTQCSLPPSMVLRGDANRGN